MDFPCEFSGNGKRRRQGVEGRRPRHYLAARREICMIKGNCVDEGTRFTRSNTERSSAGFGEWEKTFQEAVESPSEPHKLKVAKKAIFQRLLEMQISSSDASEAVAIRSAINILAKIKSETTSLQGPGAVH